VKHNTARRVILAYVDTGITALETAARLAHVAHLTECAQELFEIAVTLRELSGKIAVALGVGLKRRG
jgi:hypothetical protein